VTGGPGLGGETPAGSRRRRVYAVWVIGLIAYAVAVFHRSSLGVLAVQAQERFDTGPSVVSLFLVLQLAVYAALQIPVGLAVDRLGSRRMIVAGALTMALGQLALALAPDVPTAVGARVLIGAGDAMTFISVLRIIPAWFPAARVPLITQLTGILGQIGQVVAAYPLVTVLQMSSWQAAFTGAAAVGGLVALLVAVAFRDAPAGAVRPEPGRLADVRRDLALTVREPGTRIGLYTHLVLSSPARSSRCCGAIPSWSQRRGWLRAPPPSC
jgi:MFS family permease